MNKAGPDGAGPAESSYERVRVREREADCSDSAPVLPVLEVEAEALPPPELIEPADSEPACWPLPMPAPELCSP